MEAREAIANYKEFYKGHFGKEPTAKLIEKFCSMNGIEIEKEKEAKVEEPVQKHSPLPWKADYFDSGTGDSEKLVIYRSIKDSPVVQTIAIVEQPNIDHYIAGDNADYIVEACNNYEALQTNYQILLAEHQEVSAIAQEQKQVIEDDHERIVKLSANIEKLLGIVDYYKDLFSPSDIGKLQDIEKEVV